MKRNRKGSEPHNMPIEQDLSLKDQLHRSLQSSGCKFLGSPLGLPFNTLGLVPIPCKSFRRFRNDRQDTLDFIVFEAEPDDSARCFIRHVDLCRSVPDLHNRIYVENWLKLKRPSMTSVLFMAIVKEQAYQIPSRKIEPFGPTIWQDRCKSPASSLRKYSCSIF